MTPLRWLRLLLPLGLAGLLLGACNGAAPASSAGSAAPVLAAASIPPLADLVRQVGGERVEVVTLVPPGASPHTYEPTPAQMRRLSQARVLFLNGVGLEFWADKAVDAAANPNLRVVVLSAGLPVLQEEESPTEDGHAHTQGNPHLWLNPRLAMRYVERIRDALSEVDPDGAVAYHANAARYLDELARLDAEIRQTVATFRTREVVVFHPAWTYFCAEYGLHIAAVVEESPGKEPTPQDIAAVVAALRRAQAGALFAEPQLPPHVAEAIAAEAGVPVLYLDPLGGVPGRETYLDLMRYNLRQLAQALAPKEGTP